jgi:phage terminase large subunit-like protein
MSHIQADKVAIKRYQELCKRIMDTNAINPFETQLEQNTRIAKSKQDFALFVTTYFKHYAEAKTPEFHVRIARKVKRNKNYKGWLKWARGHAKSVVANVLLPLWLWINDDIEFMLIIGQNEDKASLLLSDIQAEFESNRLLIHDYGVQKVQGSWESGFFQTASGFIAKSLGMGQDPRGLRVGAVRPDYISADDWETKETLKNPRRQDEYAKWLLTAVIPAMGNKNKRVLICQNHFAPRVIFSKIIEENTTWDVDRVDAYDPVTYAPTWDSKYTAEYWRLEEASIGTLNANAEYNNTPHIEGKIFTDELIQWGPIPRLKHFDHICATWDVAYAGTKTSDYNAVRVWGVKNNVKYLIDCFVAQCKITEALTWIIYFQKNLPADVKVQFHFESQFWNDEVLRTIKDVELQYKIVLNLIKRERSKANKYDRMLGMLPAYQNGRVIYNIALKSHNYTQIGLAQLKGIEPGYKTKDDAPDADNEAFEILDNYTHSSGAQISITSRTSKKF